MPLVNLGWWELLRHQLQRHEANTVLIIRTLGNLESWSRLGASAGNGAVEELQELVKLLGRLQMLREEISWVLLARNFAQLKSLRLNRCRSHKL